MRVAAQLMLAGLLAAPAVAADLPPANIAVLDYQAVLRDSKAAAEIRRQIDERRKAYQEEMAREEDKLRQEEQELKQLRGSLAPAAFDERRRSFERRVQEAQRRAQDQVRSLDRAFDQAMGRLRAELVPIVTEMTKQMGYNLVVDKSQILLAARSREISEEVVEQLDRKTPRVEVALPER